MMKHNLIAILLSGLTLTACAKTTDTRKETSGEPQASQSTQAPQLQEKINKLVEKTKKNMILVEGGSFLMGDFGTLNSDDEKKLGSKLLRLSNKNNIEKLVGMPYSPGSDNKFVHLVTLDSFKMDRYKVSYRDFEIYNNAKNLPSIGNPNNYPDSLLDIIPAEVDWNQANNYCNWIGSKIGSKMQLPSEAQWEYVARNKGHYVLFATNNGYVESGKNLWSFEQYKKFSKSYDPNFIGNIPILGKTPPSPLGFYDLVTNNYEWMNDWYSEDYYEKSTIKNPQGPQTGKLKVVRSSKPQSAENLQHGEGMTINRFKQEVKPFYISNNEKIYSNKNYSFRCISTH